MRLHLLGALLLGCGGRVLVAADGGTTASSDSSSATTPGTQSTRGGDDAASGVVDPGQGFFICPPSPPEIGSSCASPGQGCAYYTGGGALSDCQAFLCDASGHWQSAPQGC